MCYSILFWNSLQPKYLDFNVVPPWDCIGNTSYCLLVNLRAVYGQPWSRVQLLVADVTLEVLCLLMVDEYLVIIKLPVAVPKTMSRKYAGKMD